jgi:hypothetical protein
LLVAVLFIVLGGSPAGGSGTYLLPVYWRNIGVIFPPQNAVTLINHVIYFGGNDITTPLIVLFLYALAGVAVISYLNWNRPARAARAAAARARAGAAEAAPAGSHRANPPGPQRGMLPIMVALGVCAIMECLFATTYMSAGHAPRRPTCRSAPWSSPVLTAAQKTISLKVTRYPNEQAAKTAIDQAQIWGALITSGTSTTLIVSRPSATWRRWTWRSGSRTRPRAPGRSSPCSSTRRSRCPPRTRSAWSRGSCWCPC